MLVCYFVLCFLNGSRLRVSILKRITCNRCEFSSIRFVAEGLFRFRLSDLSLVAEKIPRHVLKKQPPYWAHATASFPCLRNLIGCADPRHVPEYADKLMNLEIVNADPKSLAGENDSKAVWPRVHSAEPRTFSCLHAFRALVKSRPWLLPKRKS